MLAPVRQARILDEIRRQGSVRVSELTEALDVSDMTVRRDLDLLERKGLLTKVHGGATAVGTAGAVEPGFADKTGLQRREKDAIAAAAAREVRPGMAIGITAGTTTAAVAQQLTEVPELTVVTNSLAVAEIFYRQQRADRSVVLTGGERTPSDGLVGPVAVATIRSLRLDLVVLGVFGLDARGLSTPNLLEAETDRAMAQAAATLAVVADHTKWGVVGLAPIASLSAVQVLVSDDGLPDEAREVLTARVGRLVIAS